MPFRLVEAASPAGETPHSGLGALGIGDEWARKENADRNSWGTDTRRMLDSVPAPALILDARHVRPLVDLAGLRQVRLPGDCANDAG